MYKKETETMSTPDIHAYSDATTGRPAGHVSFDPACPPQKRARIVAELARTKATRSAAPGPPRLTRPYAPKSTAADAVARLTAELQPGAKETPNAAIGRRLGETQYQIVATNGHAAVLERWNGEADGGIGQHLFVGEDTGLHFALTPAFWLAYSRVRTCRPPAGPDTFGPRSRTIAIRVHDEGTIRLTAGDLEKWGYDATERIPAPVHQLPSALSEPFEIGIDDRYLWPLRDTTGTVRVNTTHTIAWCALDGGVGPVIIAAVRL